MNRGRCRARFPAAAVCARAPNGSRSAGHLIQRRGGRALRSPADSLHTQRPPLVLPSVRRLSGQSVSRCASLREESIAAPPIPDAEMRSRAHRRAGKQRPGSPSSATSPCEQLRRAGCRHAVAWPSRSVTPAHALLLCLSPRKVRRKLRDLSRQRACARAATRQSTTESFHLLHVPSSMKAACQAHSLRSRTAGWRTRSPRHRPHRSRRPKNCELHCGSARAAAPERTPTVSLRVRAGSHATVRIG